MTTLRIWLGVTLVWFFLLFNIERVYEPLDIASFVYVFAALAGTAVVLLRPLPRLPLYLFHGGLLALYLLFKIALGYEIAGPNLPITVTELCAVAATIALARAVAANVARFERSAAEVMTIGHGRPANLERSQKAMYTEVRRARNLGRPLTVVALTATNGHQRASLERFVQSVQRQTVKQYVDALLGGILVEQTHDYDLVSRSRDHFYLVLPETTGAQATSVVQRVASRARERLGLDLVSGTAEFPTEETTLTGLLKRAQTRMQNGDDPVGRRDESLWPDHEGDKSFATGGPEAS